MRRILVKVTLTDGNTGQIMKKQTMDKSTTFYYENERDNKVDYILPMLTSPFRVSSFRVLFIVA